MGLKRIFVFTGKKASGKTTACNYIISALPELVVHKMSFALPLKKMCIDILGLKPSQCFGTDSKKNTPTVWDWSDLVEPLREKFGNQSGPVSARNILQIIGTDVFRQNFSDSVWVSAAVNMIRQSDADVIVFDDGRFPNEIDCVLLLADENNKATIVRMLREKGPLGDNHPSEKAMDKYPVNNYNYIIGPEVEGRKAVEAKVYDILICEGLV